MDRITHRKSGAKSGATHPHASFWLDVIRKAVRNVLHIKLTEKAPPKPEETQRIRQEIEQTRQKEASQRTPKAS